MPWPSAGRWSKYNNPYETNIIGYIFLLSVIKVVSSDLESGLRTLGVATFCGPDVLKRFPVVVEKTEARFCDFSDAKSVSRSLLALADSESINESLAREFVDTNL